MIKITRLHGMELLSYMWTEAEIFSRVANYEAAQAGRDAMKRAIASRTVSDKEYVLAIEHDNTVIGSMWAQEESEGVYDIHPVILKEYRGKHAYAGVREAIEWMFQHSDAKKLSAEIPFSRPEVGQFAKRMGFKVINTLKDKWHAADGTLYNSWKFELEKENVWSS